MRKTPPAVNREDTNLKRGPWTAEEDQLLIGYIRKYGPGKWRTVPKNAGLNRCGKSCRLRWINYLRPDIKRGKFSLEEEETIIQLHTSLGNKWSAIAAQLPGRTDNEIKNYWNTNIRKRLLRMGFDPTANASVRSDDYYVGELSVAPTPSHPLAGLCDSSIASSSTNLPSWPGLQDILQYSVDNPSTDNPDRFHLPTSADAVALSSQSPTPQYHQKSYGKQYQGDSTHNIIGSSFVCSNDQLQPFPDYDNYINQYAQIPAHGFPLIDDGGCQIQPVNLQELPITGIESAGPPSLMDVVEDFGFGSINIITATTHAQSCCPDDQRNNFYFDNDIHMFEQS